MANAMLWLLGAVGAIFELMAIMKVFKSNGAAKKFAWILGTVLIVYSFAGLLGSYGVIDLHAVGADKFFLAATGVSAPVGADNSGNPTINPVVVPTASGNNFIIGTLKASAKEKYSNSYTAVGSGNQFLRIFDASTDPSLPTASTVDKINISSGVGTDTNKLVKTDQNYRVVFDGAGVWYDQDYGVMKFPSANYNAQSSELLFDLGSISKIGTIDKALNGTAIDGTVDGNLAFSNVSEINVSSSTATKIVYNSAVGDGQFYIQPTISFSGAYTEVKNPVLCFEWDTSSPPEGNEVSSITAQLISGTDFGIPSELVSYWSKQDCYMLGSNVAGGKAETVKLVFTVDESKLTAADDVFYMYVDDLGNIRGKDTMLNTGASNYKLQFSNE